jgi:N-acetylneuraminic acid mutarotase
MIAKLAAALSAFVLSMNANAADWERIAPLPEPNGGFVCGSVGGEIVTLGGTNWRDGTKHWLRRIHAYNPATNQWREIGMLDQPLAYAATGQDAETLWFAGGSSGTATHRSVRKIGADFAVKNAHTLDAGAVLAGGALIGTTLYVLGGTDDMNQLDRVSRAFLAVNLHTGKTTRLGDYPGPAFMTGAFAACGDRLFAFGGAHWDAAADAVANLSSAHVFSTVTQRWEELPPLPHVIRGITATALDDQHLLLAGGYKNDEEEFTDAAFIFDVKTLRYIPTKPLPYKAMVSLVKSGEWLYCLGGEDRKKQRTDAAFRIRWKELLPR